MKKVYLPFIAIAIVITSCSETKNDEILIPVKTFIKERYSALEADGIEIKQKEMSDREAIDELFKLAQKRFSSTNSEIFLNEQDTLLKKLDTLKGETKYYKVQAVKANPDTIVDAIFYFDSNKKLIKTVRNK